jgi:hypothetical protein
MTWAVEPVTGAEAGSVEIAEPETRTSTRSSEGDPANDWLCAWCLNRVASEKDRFAYDGKRAFSFANPAGVRFDIITFSRTIGCRQAGVPTLEYTWFPEHAWSFCLCDRCEIHLGWHYTGPSKFAGLMRDRIVRAVAVMN